MKRTHLELVEGSSRKFWEVWTEGKTMSVRFGRLGSDGQTKPKTFASPAAAEAEAQKLLNEKLKKGYSATKEASKEIKMSSKAGASTASSHGDAAKLAKLVPAVWEVGRTFAKQSGIEDDESFEDALGRPSKAADVDALEKELGKPLPPSYRAFLTLYGGWRGFAGGCDLLGAKAHGNAENKRRWKEWLEHFAEFEDRDLAKEGVIPIGLGDGRNTVLLEPSKRRKGEWDFVEYHLTEEEGRYPSLVALLEARQKELTGYLLKPVKAKGTKKLEGLLKKLSETSSAGLGRDLVIKWRGDAMDSVELRTNKNGEAVEELLKLGNAQDLSTLILGGANDYVRAVKAIAKSPWPAKLTRLSLGHQRWGELLPGDNKLGTLALEYPRLADLDLTPGNGKIDKVALPALKSLTLRVLKPAAWAPFAKAKLPSLERFALSAPSNDVVTAVLGAKWAAPKLKTFAVHVWRDDQVEPLADAVAKSPWAKSLKSFQVVVGSGDQYLLKLVAEAFAARKIKLKPEKGKDTED